MEATAKAKFQRFGARKVAQVLDEIRGKSVQRAEELLPGIPRRAAVMVAKTLKSATANLLVRAGKNIEADGIWITEAFVGLGPMGQMRRVRPAPMGRAMTIKRKVCHLTMTVADAPRKKGK